MRNKTEIKTTFPHTSFQTPLMAHDSPLPMLRPCFHGVPPTGQSFINCSSMDPFQRLWCSKNCYSMSPFQDVQSLKNKPLRPGFPMGHSSFQKTFSCMNCSPWARSLYQGRLLRCFWRLSTCWGMEFSIGYRGTSALPWSSPWVTGKHLFHHPPSLTLMLGFFVTRKKIQINY